jgi:hypothetical protein
MNYQTSPQTPPRTPPQTPRYYTSPPPIRKEKLSEIWAYFLDNSIIDNRIFNIDNNIRITSLFDNMTDSSSKRKNEQLPIITSKKVKIDN